MSLLEELRRFRTGIAPWFACSTRWRHSSRTPPVRLTREATAESMLADGVADGVITRVTCPNGRHRACDPR